MKAIASQLSHKEHVKQSQRPQLASHCFWAAGVQLQRSFEGCAKHLLHQIIKNAPRAGDYVARQLKLDFQDINPDILNRTRVAEMLKLLFHDTKSPLVNTPWYFVIDGLDECGFVRDDDELSATINLIQNLSKARGVKVIVASRPWAAIAKSFSRAPFLRLQDLTANDIETFVRTTLFDQRWRQFPGQEFERLVTQIVRRAGRVFLWVVPVVRELREALRNGDTIAELYERVNWVPSELQAFYERVLESLPSRSNFRIFSLIFACEVEVVEVENEAKVQPLLSTTALYFALKTTTAEVVNAKIKVDDLELVRLRAVEMSKVLREATRGLIIPEERKGETVLWPEEGNMISYLHKTAYDFLADFNIRNEMAKRVRADGFHPQLALLRAMVMQLKTQDYGIVEDYTLDDFSSLRCWSKIEQAMRYSESAFEVAAEETVRLLQEMDRVVTFQLTKWSCGSLNHHWSEWLPLGRQCNDGEKSTFLSYATSCGFHNYLRWQYDNDLIPKTKPGRPLLDYAIHPQPHFKGTQRNSLTVKLLLDNNADPHELVGGQTVYYRLLVISSSFRYENPQADWSKELNDMRVLFRSYRAELSARDEKDLHERYGINSSKVS